MRFLGFTLFEQYLETLKIEVDEIITEGTTMDESRFEKKLKELVDEISSIPGPKRDKLVMLVKQTSDCHKKLRKGVSTLQESLDYLRVSVKYLLFDLEATRRENKDLRKLLNDKN